MLTRLGGTRNHQAKFSQNWSIRKADILQFFNFPNCCRHHLSFLKSPNFWPTGSTGSRLISMSNFGKIGQSATKILKFFNFSKWRTPPSWIFKFVKSHWQTESGRHRLIGVLNVVKIGHLVVYIVQFFEFSKWPLPPSWIFWNREILLAIGAERVKTHQHAKFRPNRSIGCEDIKSHSFRSRGRNHLRKKF